MAASEITGVLITPLKILADNRGAVLHVIREDAQGFNGFGECYISEVKPQIVKAWKRHTRQTQNMTVPSGMLKLVLFDNRDDSPSKGKIEVWELGRPDNYYRITIPPHIWYGFTSISNETAMIVNCVDIPHAPDESVVLDINDPSIPYKW